MTVLQETNGCLEDLRGDKMYLGIAFTVAGL